MPRHSEFVAFVIEQMSFIEGLRVRAMFGGKKKSDRPLSLYVSGTNFQTSVWKALLQIPPFAPASAPVNGERWPAL